MDHGYFKDRISAYHDRNLKPEEQAVIEEHLKECEECRRMLEEFKKLDDLVEQHSELDGGDYWEESARRIESQLGGENKTEVTEISRSRGRGLAWKLVAVAASVAVLTVVGLNREKIWKDTEPAKDKISTPVETSPVESLDYDRGKEVGHDVGTATDELRQEEIRETQAGEDKNYAVPQPEQTGASSVSPQVTDKAEPSPPEPSAEVSDKGTPRMKKGVKADLKESPVAVPEAEGGVAMKSTTPGVQNATAEKNEQDLDDLEKAHTPDLEVSEVDIELVQLRRQKDSLVSLAGKSKTWDTTGLTTSLTQQNSKSSLMPEAKPSPAVVENELVQVCFKIGMLTEDDKEFAEVRGIIEKVAKDAKSPNRKLAESYLKQLDDR